MMQQRHDRALMVACFFFMYNLSLKHYAEVQLLFQHVHTDKIKIFHSFVFY